MPDGPEITVFRKEVRVGEPDPILSKRISLDPVTERPVSDGSACRMSQGTAYRVWLGTDPATSLAALISAMPAAEALALGRLKAGLPERVCVVTKSREPTDKALPVAVRSLDYLEFAMGHAGPVLLDFDRKDMPQPVVRRLDELGGFLGALGHLIPDFAKLTRVVRSSTSSGLRNASTGEHYPASGGLHVYLFFEDVADYPRFLQALHQRAWLAGLGWIAVSKRGRTAGARHRRRLGRQPRAPRLRGGARDCSSPRAGRGRAAGQGKSPARCSTAARSTNLTLAEAAEFRRLVQDARKQVEGAAEEVRERHVGGVARQIAEKRGIPFLAARAIVRSRYAGELRVGDELAVRRPGKSAPLTSGRCCCVRRITTGSPWPIRSRESPTGPNKAKVFHRPRLQHDNPQLRPWRARIPALPRRCHHQGGDRRRGRARPGRLARHPL